MLVEDVNAELTRRRQGYGRGGRMAIEADVARILSGVKLGKTLGTPISVLVENQDHINWRRDMSVEPLPDLPLRQVSVPRPGHADLPGIAKYGFDDIRNVLERASARETVSRVAAGAICKLLLRDIGVIVRGRVVQIGTEVAAPGDFVDPDSVDWDVVEDSPVGCDDSLGNMPRRGRLCGRVGPARRQNSWGYGEHSRNQGCGDWGGFRECRPAWLPRARRDEYFAHWKRLDRNESYEQGGGP
jgi:chorismate synthase